ncbi:family UPF0197 protein [Toxoplasma gondii TgCatPRC2]|uniref:Dolichyl-diphosphooligosaccharide-protein glycosyltransferase subunit OST5 n=15 Tax=Toxoplasma gondii TaxID=5811 RepID=A0A125YLR4_TOXGV|nr:hypothetical protein TGME49_247980 [Toxoplasma gondii ME49]EPR63709.1 hypothetical protein TGGT1_247980 [Toxoplasma gondii GT1]ESS34318.1 family UPF0197 protein [Toxoplasma gondii VEG]KAF4638589.1 hypothetical protein TGRH88_061970 [Toxoplasma gondii]KFG46681.1 family UPF0197 protein [Toxoplasma gondii GAB2-2007-GAL-DOM2]KFG54062.1 family UPF0197 protein [Toxoplasma gondii FOU]KFG64458.1 family UPF0197 protein [Toxoplasma gondii RUB]KFH12253.1 family UPF0197 protein [Toxoplasma gondii VAN|eukprot:XP_018634984.1 hypothetical protein TGME49_247980 [Toxoplasma gondii ME49]
MRPCAPSLRFSLASTMPLLRRLPLLLAHAAASPASPQAPGSTTEPKFVPTPIFIAPRLFDVISLVLLFLGLVASASFFIYHIRFSPRERSLAKEIVWSAVASVLLGFALSFLLLSSGVYY